MQEEGTTRDPTKFWLPSESYNLKNGRSTFSKRVLCAQTSEDPSLGLDSVCVCVCVRVVCVCVRAGGGGGRRWLGEEEGTDMR